jgi:hypothetical protein
LNLKLLDSASYTPDILYSNIPEEDFRKFKQFKEYLSPDQKMVLKEIAEIKREKNPVWGI